MAAPVKLMRSAPPVSSGSGASGTAAGESSQSITGVLAAGAIENDTLPLGKMLSIYRVIVSGPARIRIYQTSAARAADAGRTNFQIPQPGAPHGVIGDWWLDGSATGPFDFPCSPVVDGQNNDSPQTPSIYVAVTNLALVSAAITYTIYYVPLES